MATNKINVPGRSRQQNNPGRYRRDPHRSQAPLVKEVFQVTALESLSLGKVSLGSWNVRGRLDCTSTSGKLEALVSWDKRDLES